MELPQAVSVVSCAFKLSTLLEYAALLVAIKDEYCTLVELTAAKRADAWALETTRLERVVDWAAFVERRVEMEVEVAAEFVAVVEPIAVLKVVTLLVADVRLF